MRNKAKWSWRLRWWSILSCAAARAVASSLLEFPHASSADGGDVLPQHEIERGTWLTLAVTSENAFHAV